jgi:predicted Rdx family selenoprotein
MRTLITQRRRNSKANLTDNVSETYCVQCSFLARVHRVGSSTSKGFAEKYATLLEKAYYTIMDDAEKALEQQVNELAKKMFDERRRANSFIPVTQAEKQRVQALYNPEGEAAQEFPRKNRRKAVTTEK